MARVLTSFLATTTGVIWVPPKEKEHDRTELLACAVSNFPPRRSSWPMRGPLSFDTSRYAKESHAAFTFHVDTSSGHT